MKNLQLTGQETLLAMAILTFLVISIIVLFKFYFKGFSPTKLKKIHANDNVSESLLSRVKYPEVNVFSWSKPIFLLGLTTSILFSLFAFSWTSSKAPEYESFNYKIHVDEEIDVIPTQHPKPPAPKPPPPPDIVIPDVVVPIEKEKLFIDDDIKADDAVEDQQATPEGTGEGDGPPPPPKVEPKIVEVDDGTEEIVPVAEQMPRFPGCEHIEGTRKEKQKCAEKLLLDYIYDNLDYPKFAIDNGIQGRSIVRFVVDKSGSIKDVKVLMDPGGGCGAAAAKVVESMNNMPNKWTPGKQRGREVNVMYTLPIHFKLK